MMPCKRSDKSLFEYELLPPLVDGKFFKLMCNFCCSDCIIYWWWCCDYKNREDDSVRRNRRNSETIIIRFA